MDRFWLFLLFFTTVLTLFSLMQWRLLAAYRRWVRGALEEHRQRSWLRGGWIALGVLNLHFLLRFVVNDSGLYDEPWVQAGLIYPGGIFFAAVVLAFLGLTVRDSVFASRWLLRRLLSGRHGNGSNARGQREEQAEFNPSRRQFLRTAGLTAAASVTAVPVLGAAVTAHDYQVNNIPLRLAQVPSGLAGLRVVQISDIHSGMYMTEQNMREIFEIVNSLHPHLVLVTGDLVDNSDSQIEPLWKAVADLKAEHGVAAVLGNHDHYATADRVRAALEDRHVRVLNNEHRVLLINGEALTLIGVDDAGKGRRNYARFDEAVSGVDPETFRILLTHRPEQFVLSRSAGIPLTLAGHTHGGQVGIELGMINLNPVYLVHEYARGMYTEEGRNLYVNVGVGMVGVPIRLVRPEIALFTLQTA